MSGTEVEAMLIDELLEKYTCPNCDIEMDETEDGSGWAMILCGICSYGWYVEKGGRTMTDKQAWINIIESTVEIATKELREENERLRKQVEFNKEYGIYSNAMKEIERLRKALEDIRRGEKKCEGHCRCHICIACQALEGHND